MFSNYRVHKLGKYPFRLNNGETLMIPQGHVVERKVGKNWVFVTQTHPDSVKSLVKNLKKADREKEN